MMAAPQSIDFAGLMPEIARRLLGSPNQRLSKDARLRFGNNGSMEIDTGEGWFNDHESQAKGGVLDLIQHKRGCDKAGALRWLEDEGFKEPEPRPAEISQLGARRTAPTFYDYRDEHGAILSRVKRAPNKRFVQLGPDGRGGFHAASGCMQGVRRVPYRLPELLATDPDRVVFIVEGEKDADRLASSGLIATCNAEGAGKFRSELVRHFAGRRVVILADNDAPGFAHANDVAMKLSGTAAVATIVLLPDLPPKGDVSDWLDHGGTIDELKRAALAALDKPLLRIEPQEERTQTGAPPNDSGDGGGALLPTIEVQAGDMHNIATRAEDALIAAGAPFYVRGGLGLVRPIVDRVAASHGRTARVARLKPVDANTMFDHMSRSAKWVRFNVRKQGLAVTDPPRDAAAIVLARDGEWRFPRLAGVITTPTIRPDGSLLSAPGYDAQTQLLLLDPPQIPAISDHPTRDDALAAVAALEGLLSEFPFVDEASRSVALSGIITPVARGAMAVAPMHATTAPTPASGKSYVIDLCSAVSTGERAPVISAGKTEEETEKRLGAALLAGQSIISVDNVNGDLGGDALCQMIERPIVSLRPLGVSQLVKIESRATCFATGNNIHLVGDMTRRVVLCSLDADMERPELRHFAGDPFEAVLADRGRYIAAALTIVRAYVCAGYPSMLQPLASFEGWSRFVRSALVWLGRADPVDTMLKARSDDPVLASVGALLSAWYDAIGSSPKTSGGIKDAAETKNTFGNAIHIDLLTALLEVAEGRAGGVDPKKLGHYLARYVGRIVNGLKLVADSDPHAKQRLWKVVKA